MYPTPVVWGIPIRFNPIGLTPSGGTSGHVCPFNPNSWWVAVPKGWSSEAGAKNVLDRVESLFLLPEGVEDVLIMGMSTWMISGGLFE